MADRTPRFRLTTFDQPTDQLDYGNYKFGDGDRVLLDRLLRFATEGHTHNGQIVGLTPIDPPRLTLQTTGGTLRPTATVYYRYSIVDSRGQESIASNVATVRTPSQATAPQYAPRLQPEHGVMDGGDYLYAVSACTGDASQETIIGPSVTGTLTTFGSWYMDLPPLPNGAEFFNLYRKAPRDRELVHLATLAPEARSYTDDGTVKPNIRHGIPQANTTRTTNSVTISPGNNAPIPSDSWTWKIYRTFDPTNWDNSLLDWVGAVSEYTDDGRATRPGLPPESNAAIGGAPKIEWTVDTIGVLPPRMLVHNRLVNFNSDIVVAGPGQWHWFNEYDLARPAAMRASLGRGSVASADISIGADIWQGVQWDPIFASCTIPAGSSQSDHINLDGTFPHVDWTLGTRVRMNVQSAEPVDAMTARDLTFTLTLRVTHGPSDQTYQWKAT